MSWFKKALTIALPLPGAYYTAIDPVEFYEWRFNQFVPKGAMFTKKLPRSDIFTQGRVIVSATIPPESLEKKSFGYELKKDTESDVVLTAGQIASPVELILKYKNLKDNFYRTLDQFKQSYEARQYMVSIGDNPHLYRLASQQDGEVELENFGAIKEIKEKLQEARIALGKATSKKVGKAHELEKYRKFENAMVLIESLQFPLDAPKTTLLLRSANIQPEQKRKMPWKQCYIELSEDASQLASRLSAFNELNWVQQTMNYTAMFS